MKITDTDTATDTYFAVPEQSIAVLRKRHGTEMCVAGAVPSDLVRNDLDTGHMNVEMDLDATQISGPTRKYGKKDDVTKDMISLRADVAASEAVREVMALMVNSNMTEKRVADRLEDVAKNSVNEVVAEISESLNGRMSNWEGKSAESLEDVRKEVGRTHRAVGTRI